MLGTEEGKKGLVADLDHWIAKGDEKWLGWFGEKDGPFNTRCFQGGISDEDLGEAATRYAAGELPLGAVAVRDSLLARLDRAGLRNAKDVTNIRGRTPHIPKDMWRKGLVECPDFCDPETTPLDECRCACPASQLERSEWDRDLFELYVGSALNARMLGQYSEEDLRKGIEIVCNAGILVGDEEQSSSPADPLFWPIHPTIERLYQWKMLNGGFEDDTWPETGNYNSPIYVGTMAMCTGHNPNDLLPWKLRLGREQQARSYTNAELRNLIDPSSPEYQLPYVYDHFQWKHCAEEGYDFDQIGWRSV